MGDGVGMEERARTLDGGPRAVEIQARIVGGMSVGELEETMVERV